MHIHHNLAAAISIFIMWAFIYIPLKIIAAAFVGRNRTADVVFGIL